MQRMHEILTQLVVQTPTEREETSETGVISNDTPLASTVADSHPNDRSTTVTTDSIVSQTPMVTSTATHVNTEHNSNQHENTDSTLEETREVGTIIIYENDCY
jgi:hypothetical protein